MTEQAVASVDIGFEQALNDIFDFVHNTTH